MRAALAPGAGTEHHGLAGSPLRRLFPSALEARIQYQGAHRGCSGEAASSLGPRGAERVLVSLSLPQKIPAGVRDGVLQKF